MIILLEERTLHINYNEYVQELNINFTQLFDSMTNIPFQHQKKKKKPNHKNTTYKEHQYAEAGEISETFAPTWDVGLFSLYRK